MVTDKLSTSLKEAPREQCLLRILVVTVCFGTPRMPKVVDVNYTRSRRGSYEIRPHCNMCCSAVWLVLAYFNPTFFFCGTDVTEQVRVLFCGTQQFLRLFL